MPRVFSDIGRGRCGPWRSSCRSRRRTTSARRCSTVPPEALLCAYCDHAPLDRICTCVCCTAEAIIASLGLRERGSAVVVVVRGGGDPRRTSPRRRRSPVCRRAAVAEARAVLPGPKVVRAHTCVHQPVVKRCSVLCRHTGRRARAGTRFTPASRGRSTCGATYISPWSVVPLAESRPLPRAGLCGAGAPRRRCPPYGCSGLVFCTRSADGWKAAC